MKGDDLWIGSASLSGAFSDDASPLDLGVGEHAVSVANVDAVFAHGAYAGFLGHGVHSTKLGS